MFITLKWCLIFGAAVCLGVPYHSSETNQQEITEAGSENKASQFMLELYHKVGKSEWKDEEMPDNNIEEFTNEGFYCKYIIKYLPNSQIFLIGETRVFQRTTKPFTGGINNSIKYGYCCCYFNEPFEHSFSPLFGLTAMLAL